MEKFSTKKNALIVFSRNPILGKVKTRIAKSCGNKKALEIYKKLIQINEKTISNFTEIKTFIFFDENIDNQYYKNEIYKEKQEGNTLGEKMLNAFKLVKKKGYKNIIIIGNDCPYITSLILKNAFEKLNKYDYVIGPTYDGGYYLLGMKKINKNLFIEKEWSTESVFEDTLKNIKKEDKKIFILEKLEDIDYYENWTTFKNKN